MSRARVAPLAPSPDPQCWPVAPISVWVHGGRLPPQHPEMPHVSPLCPRGAWWRDPGGWGIAKGKGWSQCWHPSHSWVLLSPAAPVPHLQVDALQQLMERLGLEALVPAGAPAPAGRDCLLRDHIHVDELEGAHSVVEQPSPGAHGWLLDDADDVPFLGQGHGMAVSAGLGTAREHPHLRGSPATLPRSLPPQGRSGRGSPAASGSPCRRGWG